MSDDAGTVLVYDRSPLTRLAVTTVLARDELDAIDFADADALVERCRRTCTAATPAPATVAVIGISIAADASVIEQASEIVGVAAIAVLADPSPEVAAELLHVGATSVVRHDDVQTHLVDAIARARSGYATVPTEVIRWVAARSDPGQLLAQDEITWIRELERGSTISRLAAEVGYSERNMYRLLHGLYVRLGVSSREQAIDVARRRGLI